MVRILPDRCLSSLRRNQIRCMESSNTVLRESPIRSNAPALAARRVLRSTRGCQRRCEAFEKQIQTGVQFEQLVGQVTQALCGKLPWEAIYTLHFPLHTALKVKSTKLGEVQEKLAEWVRENATCLDARNRQADVAEQQGVPGRHDSIVGTPPGFDYEVTLHRYPRRGLGRRERGWIAAIRVPPEDAERSRTSRVGSGSSMAMVSLLFRA